MKVVFETKNNTTNQWTGNKVTFNSPYTGEEIDADMPDVGTFTFDDTTETLCIREVEVLTTMPIPADQNTMLYYVGGNYDYNFLLAKDGNKFVMPSNPDEIRVANIRGGEFRLSNTSEDYNYVYLIQSAPYSS